MKGKRKLGMRLKNGKKLRLKKRRNIKPMLLPILGALGSLGGGAAGIAKAENEAEASKNVLRETESHNKTMENLSKDSGLFIKIYETGRKIAKGKGLYKKRYKGGSIKETCIQRRVYRKKLK